MSTESAVVRFAPSPSGPPHLGNMRTALFNWLLARATGGRFILRIEDTDRTRYQPAAEREMLDALRWLGLEWDEGPDIGGPNGPYRQSERLSLYHAVAERLIAGGSAYRCTCSPERLARVQAQIKARGRAQLYDNHCRDLNIGPTTEPHVIRLRVPLSGSIPVADAIRGAIPFEYKKLAGDIVLMKSDGFPTYHLAVVVDDHMMGVTHALRGDEWIPSAPLHVLLYQTLGWKPPIFVHLPLVTDREGKKIKKREPTFQVSTYRTAGYLPEAVINALALLGWNPGTTQEYFTRAELIEQFSIERLSKSPSVFDEARLRWFNRQHIAQANPDELVKAVLPILQNAYGEAVGQDIVWVRRLVEMVHDELTTLNNIVAATAFVFDPGPPDEEAQAALRSAPAYPVLEAFRDELSAVETLSDDSSAVLLRTLRGRFKKEPGWDGRAVMFPLRAALTSRVTGPHLSDVVVLLGKGECLRRIDMALEALGQSREAHSSRPE